MPAKSKPADSAAMVSEDAVRQRAYYLWEADGRPEGKHDHYWTLAHQEATKAFAEATANGVAKAGKGKSPGAIPAAVKSKPPKEAKPVKVKAAKAAEAKPTKKAATKPRAAVPAKKAK
ncbi:hypothetical protein VW23_023290 [Devosia insulae DS-56]|uniref:DUF2934 domain-containing protein n=1 Tax=Devosia insulae DS-56 TaxID=1116389 RepID=A0A1E5XN23_9HYPH|nr:DUF2934 domain-containing protein [Devosia insulae]OEO30016.1 hypothetical protein VW23_023290 [Devosia insulae DS-56]